MKKAVIVVIIVGVLILGALNVHVIITDGGVKVLKKTGMTFEDTFVDTRGAKKLKILTKPALIEAGIRNLLK
jgi:hypothetical protein